MGSFEDRNSMRKFEKTLFHHQDHIYLDLFINQDAQNGQKKILNEALPTLPPKLHLKTFTGVSFLGMSQSRPGMLCNTMTLRSKHFWTTQRPPWMERFVDIVREGVILVTSSASGTSKALLQELTFDNFFSNCAGIVCFSSFFRALQFL